MLIDNRLYNKVKEKLDVNDIDDELLKPVITFIFERLEDGKTIDINDISFMLDNAKLKDEFKDIFDILYNGKEVNEKIVDDCIREIIKDDLNKKIIHIKREIDNSYITGDVEKERELLVQLQNYEKEMLKLKKWLRRRLPRRRGHP